VTVDNDAATENVSRFLTRSRSLKDRTYLTHFDILDQMKVDETTNTLNIVTSMQLAHKVINL
jgi:hypothetical protein